MDGLSASNVSTNKRHVDSDLGLGFETMAREIRLTGRIVESSRSLNPDQPPTKRRRLSDFDVEEMIRKLNGPERLQEKARLKSLRAQEAINILDSIQGVRTSYMFSAFQV
jgi:hypothetical protein